MDKKITLNEMSQPQQLGLKKTHYEAPRWAKNPIFCSRHPLRILYPRKHWDFKYWTQLLRRLDFEARITKALKTKLNQKQSKNVQYQKQRRAWVNFDSQL